MNISETDNALDLDLALSVAEYFRLDKQKSQAIINQVKKSVRDWRIVAKEIGISKAEQDRMSNAFE